MYSLDHQRQSHHVPRGLDYAPSVTRDPDLTKKRPGAGTPGAVHKDHCLYSGGCVKVMFASILAFQSLVTFSSAVHQSVCM